MRRVKPLFYISLLVMVLLGYSAAGVRAGDVVLSNNQGIGVSTWFISGEPTLIMNGFDLTARNVNLPVSVDRVSIDVETPMPGQPVILAIYQDATGGSPIDATLVYEASIEIAHAGVHTVQLPTPVQITAPVVWIGFYLPVDFVFRGDTSGSSVLTYWAWTPGDRFNLANLASATVFGPGDGSAPVNINMGGVARITAEIITDGTRTTTETAAVVASTVGGVPRDADGRILPVVGGEVNLAPMLAYPECVNVLYDTQDISVTYRGGVRFFCKIVQSQYAPISPDGFARRGMLYDVYVFGVESGATRLPHPVTHCVRPPDEDLTRAVFGLASGAPRQWQVLPTVRYGDIICAEVHFSGFVSHFIPTN